MVELKESLIFKHKIVYNPPIMVNRIYSYLEDCKNYYILKSCYLMDNANLLDVSSTYKQNQIEIRISDHYLCTLEPIIIYERCIHELIYKKAISLHSSAVVINNCVFIFLGRSGAGKTTLSKIIAEEFRGEIICDDTLTLYMGLNSKLTLVNPLSKKHYSLDIKNIYILKIDECTLFDCMIRPDNINFGLALIYKLEEQINLYDIQYGKNIFSIDMVKEVIKAVIDTTCES